jgi:hypothetical protein
MTAPAPLPERVAGDGLDGSCPRCGTPVAPHQEYCLECGLRLPLDRQTLSRLAGERGSRAGGDWRWPVLAWLVVACVAAAGALLWTRDGDDGQALIATTTGELTMPERTATAPSVSEVTETTPGPITQEPPTATTPTAPPPPPPRPRTLIRWPDGRSGYTVVLASVPSAGGRPAAVRRARQALQSGLRDVGVLDSSQYSSLHPGYFVVFAGIYKDFAAAERAAGAAQDEGFDGAYPKAIAS